jgi:hypothetical protein
MSARAVVDNGKRMLPFVKNCGEDLAMGYLGARFVTHVHPFAGAVFLCVESFIYKLLTKKTVDELARMVHSVSLANFIKIITPFFIATLLSKLILPTFTLLNGLGVYLVAIPIYMIYQSIMYVLLKPITSQRS